MRARARVRVKVRVRVRMRGGARFRCQLRVLHPSIATKSGPSLAAASSCLARHSSSPVKVALAPTRPSAAWGVRARARARARVRVRVGVRVRASLGLG